MTEILTDHLAQLADDLEELRWRFRQAPQPADGPAGRCRGAAAGARPRHARGRRRSVADVASRTNVSPSLKQFPNETGTSGAQSLYR